MPYFSIVIPAYNNEHYLPACLDSLVNQQFSDWEGVVVVDGSPDSCAEVARAYAAKDERFMALVKAENKGTHRARVSGVTEASGKWTIFLDADDELEPFALQAIHDAIESSEGCDIFRFGTSVVAAGMSEHDREDFARFGNVELPVLTGHEIPESSFVEPVWQDWRILQRAYRTDMLKRAFSLMSHERFGRGQDGYECFVISGIAEKQVTDSSIRGYRYYLGRGITTDRSLDIEGFSKIAKSYGAEISAAFMYAAGCSAHHMRACARGYRGRLTMLLANDWHDRVPDELKLEAAHVMAEHLGAGETASELMRLSRDEAYRIWDTGGGLTGDETFLAWMNLAEELAEQANGSLPDEYAGYSSAARGHVEDLRARSSFRHGFFSKVAHRLGVAGRKR